MDFSFQNCLFYLKLVLQKFLLCGAGIRNWRLELVKIGPVPQHCRSLQIQRNWDPKQTRVYPLN